MLLVLPLITLSLIWQVSDGVALEYRFLGYTLALVKGDALSRLFATTLSIAEMRLPNKIQRFQ